MLKPVSMSSYAYKLAIDSSGLNLFFEVLTSPNYQVWKQTISSGQLIWYAVKYLGKL